MTYYLKIVILITACLLNCQNGYGADTLLPEKPAAAPVASPGISITDKDILSYLQQTISWKSTLVEEDLPTDNARIALLKDSLIQNSHKLLKNAFDFARITGALLEKDKAVSTDEGKDTHASLFKKINENKLHIEALKDQLETINTQIEQGRSSSIALLKQQKEQLSEALAVANAHQDLLNNFGVIFGNNGSNDDFGLLGSINKLSHSVSNELNETPAIPKTDAKDALTYVETDDGILSIGNQILNLSHKKNNIDKLLEKVKAIKASNTKLVNQMRDSLRASIQEGENLANAPMEKDQNVKERRKNLDSWLKNYKKLSAAVLPLGQVTALLDTSTASLQEWQVIIEQEWGSLFRHFLLRFLMLSISIMIPFVFLELSKRASQKYIKDPVRLRQINVVRQIIFFTFLTLLIFLNFFTEFGSLATYAGFLTAGIAVALQTVLVSLTAHFFFFGRFGVRSGDRVSISGVTGDVIHVGVLRIYLMELLGDENDLRPSGKIVAFPNSILFNSTAFSKKILEKNYTWNDLNFVFDPNTEFSVTSKKIMEIVNSVYKGYSEAIERQYHMLEQSTQLYITPPAPKSEIIIRDNTIRCKVHYPVLNENAVLVYEEIIKKLIVFFNEHPTLNFILSSPFKIEAKSIHEPALPQ